MRWETGEQKKEWVFPQVYQDRKGHHDVQIIFLTKSLYFRSESTLVSLYNKIKSHYNHLLCFRPSLLCSILSLLHQRFFCCCTLFSICPLLHICLNVCCCAFFLFFFFLLFFLLACRTQPSSLRGVCFPLVDYAESCQMRV